MSKFFTTCLDKRDISINDSFLLRTIFKQIKGLDFDGIENHGEIQ